MAILLKKEQSHRNPETGLAPGICSATISNINPPFTMAHNIMAPGYRCRTHYHTKVCRGTYVVKGRIRFFFGPEDNQQVIDAEEGDYIYTALGEIHSQLNLSDTEIAEYVSSYVGECDRDKVGTVFVDTPKK